MKKTIMSLVMAATLVNGTAFAAIGNNGQAGNNDASQATLNFNGKVTSSLCQVSTGDIQKDIELGEVSSAALKAQKGRGPSKSFSVSLVNCDGDLANIAYVFQDKNGNNTNNYLVPESSDTAAKGVGVYLEDAQNNSIDVGVTKTHTAVNGADNKALPNQTIPLAAYIGTTSGNAGTIGTNVTAGIVKASAVMTIRATANATAKP
ncbi:type 1 fimbrial protein [Escherichia coli]|nr:type 1 fimbrial protein [Escherichia coli]